MVRLSVLASLLLSLVIPCNATSAPLAKEAEVNGVRIQYLTRLRLRPTRRVAPQKLDTFTPALVT